MSDDPVHAPPKTTVAADIDFSGSFDEEDVQKALHNPLEKLRIVRPKKPIRELRRVGRNEKCPCGSGRKTKHCHPYHYRRPW